MSLSSLQGGAPPVIQNSRALNTLCRLLRSGKKQTVLDLAPLSLHNLEFFGNYLCKFYISDLFDELSAPLAKADAALVQEAGAADNMFAGLLAHSPAGTRFDIIFAWDMFNYLSREQLHRLAGQLAPFCNPGALLFALISNTPEVAQRPLCFKILDEDNLSFIEPGDAARPNSRYRETNVARLLPGFRANKTFLLRNGIQECLFSFG